MKRIGIAVFLMLTLALTGCRSGKEVLDWSSRLSVPNVSEASVWAMSAVEILNEDEIALVVEYLNELTIEDVTENKRLAGPTPEYGLTIVTDEAQYNLNQSGDGVLELGYGGKQWWISSAALDKFVIDKTQWEAPPVWDGRVTPTDLETA